MAHKYLKELGVASVDDDGIFFGMDEEKINSRKEVWDKQIEEYGFCDRETWELFHTFMEWLYEHVKMFLDVNIIDLDFHKFEYKGEQYTQQQMIDMLLENLEALLKISDPDFEPKYWECYNNVLDIWKIIAPAMWW